MALTDNLISYWKFDEASGNALDSHGTNPLTDNNTVGAGAGKINGARDLTATGATATSEFFTRGSGAILLEDNNFTFAGWFRIDNASTSRGILFQTVSASLPLSLIWSQSLGRLQYVIIGGPGPTTTTINTANSSVAGSTWYHVVIWHDATNNNIGLVLNNGTPLTAGHSVGLNDSGGLHVLRFGHLSDAISFDGLLDEWGYWQRVLTSEDIATLYNSGDGTPYEELDGGGGGGGGGETQYFDIFRYKYWWLNRSSPDNKAWRKFSPIARQRNR